MLKRIDLNCDLGEGCAFDEELMTLVTSANVACGFHAGDASTARAMFVLAEKHDVSAGAHPSFPDRESFGRREMDRSPDQILHDCIYQIGALDALARSIGSGLSHVKPHGALYNMACRDESIAKAVAEAARLFDLKVFGLPGSALDKACDRFIAEGFADRRYLPDGSLVPRSRPDAMIEDAAEAVQQAIRLVSEFGVQTLCVHGDNPKAVEFVRSLRAALLEEGFKIRRAI